MVQQVILILLVLASSKSYSYSFELSYLALRRFSFLHPFSLVVLFVYSGEHVSGTDTVNSFAQIHF